MVKEEHFRGPGPQVGRCRRIGAGCRDRQSGEHVDKKPHRQPRVATEGGVLRGHVWIESPLEGTLNAAERGSRQVAADDNGKA
jgi:hypothetical protein